MARLHLDGIGHRYGGAAYALDPSDIVFEDGKTYALLGPSGCGKTTCSTSSPACYRLPTAG